MERIRRNTGISTFIGKYSDGIEVQGPTRWLYSAGTPGLLPDGTLAEGIEPQTRQAWANIAALLKTAGMGFEHLIKVNTTLTRAEHIPVYAQIRAQILGELRPAFMLQVVDQMIKPDFLVEIEIVAAS